MPVDQMAPVTVISLHEYPGPVGNPEDVKILRGNTLSVLSQLSLTGSADAISLQAIRQALEDNSDVMEMGRKGSSLLFYYLFEDWRAVFFTVAMYDKRLGQLVCSVTPLPLRLLMSIAQNDSWRHRKSF
jgi:hypothetical protein